MKKALLGSVAVVALITTPALAADLARRAPPPYYKAPPAYVAPIYTWTGCYVGADVGGGWIRDKDTETVTSTGVVTTTSPTSAANPSGVKAGGYFGCDYEFAGGFVIGAEGDAQWADIRGSGAIFPGTGTPPDSYETKADFQGSVRARVGYAFDRFMVYATGGGAWAHIKEDDFVGGTSIVEEHSTTRPGWTVGAGVEYAILNNLIGRVEYRYSDFGTFSYDSVVAFPGLTESHKITENQVLVGLAYKFY